MNLYSTNLDNVNYAIREVESLAKKYGKGKELTYLNIGDPVKLGLPTPKSVSSSAIKSIRAGNNFYAQSNGFDRARKAVSEFYGKRKINVNSDDIFITTGVSEAINVLYLTLFNSNESIALPKPYYPLYNALANLYNIKINYYELDDQGLPDINSIDQSLHKRTKALVLINPNNPMGSNISAGMLDEIKELLEQKKIVLIADEIYSEMLYNEKMNYAQKGSEDGLVITLSGISKAYRVPGWRIGWAVFGKHPLLSRLKYSFSKLLELRLCSPTPFQYALPSILNEHSFFKAYRNALKRNAALVEKKINSSPLFHVNPIKATYYAFIKIGWEQKSRAFTIDLIKNKGIVVVPGYGFGRENYFRIVFAGDKKKLKDALDSIIAESMKHL